MKITRLFNDFFHNEKSSGLILICCTALSLIFANTGGDGWLHFWHTDLGGQSVEYWINDGLMTIFFLLVGLELEREVYIGELSDIKEAALPIFGALGGMLLPAAIFLASISACRPNAGPESLWRPTSLSRWPSFRYWANVSRHRSRYS